MTTEADERPTDETTPAADAAQPAAQSPGEPAAPAESPAGAEAPAQAAAAEGAPAPESAQAPEAPAETPASAQAPEAAEAPSESAEPQGEAVSGGEPGASAESPKDGPKPAGKKPRRRKPRERRKAAPEVPRVRAPLPLDQLRDASRSTMNLFGPRRALRDALGVLAPRERQELNLLIAADEDHRPRARNIANGSIGAGRIDKAMAATIVSMAPQEELWGVLLDKEQAAQKLGRIRQAKQRDKQRADRAAERANRADRVSREDMAKATDGSVGATIRFVSAGDEKRERREKEAAKKKSSGSVLDRLGY